MNNIFQMQTKPLSTQGRAVTLDQAEPVELIPGVESDVAEPPDSWDANAHIVMYDADPVVIVE